jgi:hypothetical protein
MYILWMFLVHYGNIEYWIPKNIFLVVWWDESMFLALEKLINDSLMNLKWHIFGTLFKSKFIMIL